MHWVTQNGPCFAKNRYWTRLNPQLNQSTIIYVLVIYRFQLFDATCQLITRRAPWTHVILGRRSLFLYLILQHTRRRWITSFCLPKASPSSFPSALLQMFFASVAYHPSTGTRQGWGLRRRTAVCMAPAQSSVETGSSSASSSPRSGPRCIRLVVRSKAAKYMTRL